MSEIQESLEWRSVLDAVVDCDIRAALPALDQRGVVAYTDGACIKNPGGPAGWSALLWAAVDSADGRVRAGAPCLERYGHIPRAPTTTNNRAEIAAVLAVLSLAPPALPLTIYSDSEYTIKVAQGVYQMKANPDLWAIYRKLLGYRTQPPEFIWVRGHAGHLHNERADELAGLGAFNGDRAAYEAWQASQAPEAHNSLPPAELLRMREQAQRLKALFETISPDSSRVSEKERQFINDMAKRLQKNNFAPTEKQRGWLRGLATKYRV
ncbi:MAG TPA: RNase H family protein, partial [Ktedonobacteraceae bacterium]|jgi:ribonuclease HI|nr:RNase H family protein [Ktedonobacteraceae bacterium]